MTGPGDIEQFWTCDAEGNWRQERRVRIRDTANGWHEFKVIDQTTARDEFRRMAGIESEAA